MTPVLKLQNKDILLPRVFPPQAVFEADCDSDSWPEEIVNLISRCWEEDPDQRPSFDNIYEYWNFHRDRLLKHRFKDSGAWWFKKSTTITKNLLPERPPPRIPESVAKKRLGSMVLHAAKKSAERIFSSSDENTRLDPLLSLSL